MQQIIAAALELYYNSGNAESIINEAEKTEDVLHGQISFINDEKRKLTNSKNSPMANKESL